MKYVKYIWLSLAFLIAGCSTQPKDNIVNNVPLYEEELIILQNLTSRVLAYCYASPDFTAEECAEKFEQEGYVRLKDIPKMSAEYDFLKEDTYPTRRWRKNNLIPRW